MIEVNIPNERRESRDGAGEQQCGRVSLREKGGIPFKCGGGICGTCKCRIERGLENTDAIKPKERKHLTEEQFAGSSYPDGMPDISQRRCERVLDTQAGRSTQRLRRAIAAC